MNKKGNTLNVELILILDCVMEPITYPSFAVKEPIAHTSLKFSPHNQKLLAVGSASNFGIVGKGRAQVRALEGKTVQVLSTLEESDAIFDISWCEFSDNLLLAGCGNGSIIFWDITKGKVFSLETKNQVQSVEFAYKLPVFLATNMNGYLHMGDSDKAQIAFSLQAHQGSCYTSMWHPTSPKVFASGGGDGFLKLWDHSLQNKNIATLKAHEGEIMSIDFNKYQQIIATSSSDKTIKLWDLRNLKLPVNILTGHRYPIRRIKFSPFSKNILASGSYDMNVNIYDISKPTNPLLIKHAQHTQFVSGLDFNMFNEKILGTCSWDGRILVWPYDMPQPLIT